MPRSGSYTRIESAPVICTQEDSYTRDRGGRFRSPGTSSPNELGSFGSLNGPANFPSGSVPNLTTCPSCNGLGRVPKDRESELVALIPMKDRRLKPRRTILYVGVSIAVCVTVAVLLIFFLIPRDIIITSNEPHLDPVYVHVNVTAQFVNFTVVNLYNVTNNNFYPVTIKDVYMKAQYGDAVIASADAYNFQNTSADVGSRSHLTLFVPITFILDGLYGRFSNHCVSPVEWIHNLPIQFMVTISYSFLGHSEQETLDTFQTVSCYPIQPVSTTKHTPSTSPVTTTAHTSMLVEATDSPAPPSPPTQPT